MASNGRSDGQGEKPTDLSAVLRTPDGEEHDVTEIMFPQGEGVQLSLEVEPHPAIDVAHGKGFIAGTLRIAGELPIQRDLNAGDRLLVLVQNADGELLTQGELECEAPGFKVVKHKDLGPVGMERRHTATVDLDA